ncbi:hypothetical protein [Alteromonas sp. a30]|uniref:hypothetical protein n=1 Tax=Alteromonas sp. a30 TaxID=2730917 RepID=UPI0022827C7F|nr:hypothetical protein [Alteromonas sp. a30]MCY7295065.1 hypothetical protein [Alteromonas sp. a30]
MLDSILLVLILGCEIAFWVVLFLGMFARYVIGWPKFGLYCLYSIPLIDVLLFIVTVVDLRSGTTATFFHGLAAAYIGFSIIFGHGLIRWADERFAHRFANGPKPQAPPSVGWGNIKYELILFAKALLACAITFVLVRVMIWMVNDEDKILSLYMWDNMVKVLAFFWLVFGPGYSLLFRLNKKEEDIK